MSSSRSERDIHTRADPSPYTSDGISGSPENLINMMNGMIWEAESRKGEKSQFTFVSQNVVSLLGYPLDRWLHEPDFCETCLHPDDKDWVYELRERTFRERGGFDCEYRLISANGKTVWIRCVAKVVDEDGDRITMRGLAIDITAKKESQQATAESEALVRSVLSSLRSHIAVLDTRGRIIAVNDAWNSFAAENGPVSNAKVGVGADYLQICWDALRTSSVGADDALVGIRAVIDGTKNFYRQEYICPYPSGTKWFAMTVTQLKRPEGGAVVSHTDITERKLAEQTLRNAEDRNRAFIKAVPDLMFLMTKDGVYLDYHAKDPSLLFTTPDQFLGKRMSDIMPPRHSAEFLRCFKNALTTDEQVVHEYSLDVPMGVRHFEARVVPCRPDQILCIVRDFTDRKLTEEELKKNKRFIQQINDTMPTVLYLYDCSEQRVAYVNKQIASVLGYIEQEVQQFNSEILSRLVHPDDLSAVTEQFAGLWTTGDGQFIEGDCRIKHKNGEWRCLHLRWTVFSRQETGEVKEILGTALDITERKLAEDRLTESQKRYSLASLAGGVSVWDYDLETGDIYCDSTLAQILGFTDDEKQTVADWLDVIHPDDRDRVLAHGKKALDGETPLDSEGNSPVPEIEYRVLHKDGAVRWFLNRATILRNPRGNPYRIIGTITDITGRKRAELALNSSREALRKTNRQVKKLVGKLLLAQEDERKRISRELHDGVNQQIAALGISVSRLKSQLSGDDIAARNQITNLEARINEASESIRDLSHRLHSTVLQHVGLVSALNSYCIEVSRDEGVTVNFSVQGESTAIPADAALCVYRITQESLRNVVKHSRAKMAEVTLGFTPGHLALNVVDWGVGFDAQQVRSEQGLGLISIEERAAQLKGSAQIVSCPGKGTQIQVEIPIGGTT